MRGVAPLVRTFSRDFYVLCIPDNWYRYLWLFTADRGEDARYARYRSLSTVVQSIRLERMKQTLSFSLTFSLKFSFRYSETSLNDEARMITRVGASKRPRDGEKVMGPENYITRHRKKLRPCPLYDLVSVAIRKIFARNRVASASSRDEIARRWMLG